MWYTLHAGDALVIMSTTANADNSYFLSLLTCSCLTLSSLANLGVWLTQKVLG